MEDKLSEKYWEKYNWNPGIGLVLDLKNKEICDELVTLEAKIEELEFVIEECNSKDYDRFSIRQEYYKSQLQQLKDKHKL
jgi:hypothetical protein